MDPADCRLVWASNGRPARPLSPEVTAAAAAAVRRHAGWYGRGRGSARAGRRRGPRDSLGDVCGPGVRGAGRFDGRGGGRQEVVADARPDRDVRDYMLALRAPADPSGPRQADFFPVTPAASPCHTHPTYTERRNTPKNNNRRHTRAHSHTYTHTKGTLPATSMPASLPAPP